MRRDREQAERLERFNDDELLQPIIDDLNPPRGYAISEDYPDIDRMLVNDWGDSCRDVMTQHGAQGENLDTAGDYCDNIECGYRAMIYDRTLTTPEEAADRLSNLCNH
jgi:hypothetical protein